MNKTISQWKEFYIKSKMSEKRMKEDLEYILKAIKALENMYQIQGDYYKDYSESFKDQAYKERQRLCQHSSALHSILRDS